MTARNRKASGVEPGHRGPAPERLRPLQAFLNSNDIEEDHDEFATPDQFGRWLRRHDLATARVAVTEGDRQWAISVREALRDLIEAREQGGDTDGPAAVLNAAARAADVSLVFGPAGGALAPGQDGVRAAVGQVLAKVPLAMAGGDWHRLKVCRNDACRWVFYDSSRNRSGRWCTMAICGNRMKARAHRARTRR